MKFLLPLCGLASSSLADVNCNHQTAHPMLQLPILTFQLLFTGALESLLPNGSRSREELIYIFIIYWWIKIAGIATWVSEFFEVIKWMEQLNETKTFQMTPHLNGPRTFISERIESREFFSSHLGFIFGIFLPLTVDGAIMFKWCLCIINVLSVFTRRFIKRSKHLSNGGGRRCGERRTIERKTKCDIPIDVWWSKPFNKSIS